MLQEKQIKILMLMHELEELLAEMYRLFSEKFPARDGLWQTLIHEEQEHAEAVRTLYRLTYKKESLFSEGALRAEGVQTVIDYIRGMIDSARRGRFSEIQALTAAHDIEKSMIERDLFAYFKVRPEYAETLKYLRESSHSHIELTKIELEKALKEQPHNR